MKIKSLNMINFRQYKGEQKVEFSIDNEKNVTVILGKNTSGKTTIIQAFKWCLYGVHNFPSKSPLLNLEVSSRLLQSESENVSVQIVLTHGGKDYFITRIQTFTRNFETIKAVGRDELRVIIKDIDGSSSIVDSDDAQEEVDKILPQALSGYFFFDGENLKELNSGTGVVKAVHGLMGLEVLKEVVNRFNPQRPNSVVSKLRKELDLGGESKTLEYNREVDRLKTEIEGLENQISVVDDEIEKLDLIIKEKTQEISKNEKVAEKQRRRSLLEKEIKVVEQDYFRQQKIFTDSLNEGIFLFCASILIPEAVSVIDSAKHSAEGIPEMRASSIDYIMQRGKCICGANIVEDSKMEENILFEKSLLPPQHVGTALRNTKNEYKRTMNSSANFADRIKDLRINVRNVKKDLDKKNTELEKISEDLIGNVDVSKLELSRLNSNNSLRANYEKRGNLNNRKSNAESELQKIEQKINNLKISNKKNSEIERYIEYALELHKHFEEAQDKRKNEVRSALQENVNRIFKEMYHGDRVLKIADDYKIELFTEVDNVAVSNSESMGLETVKNFSFVAGLVEIARSKVEKKNTDPDCIATEPYPFVMDAPFSNVDEEHISNISAILPTVGEQVVLVLMEKDWNHAKEKMSSKLGQVYYVEKVNNTDSHSRIRLD